MAVRIESQAEPIPGYRLIERLGGGGFGEVWKAEAPGGLFKAIKFVYGELDAAGGEAERAEQELKAIKRVQTVRHPYILSLERYDIIDGQLVIVMELADRNLWDRFKECRNQGLPGVPRQELLGYMMETAEALDLMNGTYQLQHLDIKPQNLFLVHNHTKVADFGLVKDLEGMAASVTGGVTPVYAAPETFDGWVSRFSDQYSLGIVYQELLTGLRPFPGTNVRQLVMQHLQGTPNLSALPPGDQPIIARALAKNPDERHPTCLDMVRALCAADQAAATPEVISSAETTPQAASSSETPQAALEPEPAELEAAPEEGSQPVTLLTARRGSLSSQQLTRYAEAARAETDASAGLGDGVLFPALVIGVGGAGLAVLRQLRAALHALVPTPAALGSLRFLYVDTDPAAPRAAKRAPSEACLGGDEVALLRLHRPSHYLRKRDNRPEIATWLDPEMLYRIPRTQTTAGFRALGRLAFCDNYRPMAHRLRVELEACCDPEALKMAVKQTRLGVRATRPRVYVVASLAGGSGSGMFLDLAYVTHAALTELGHADAEMIGVLLLPPSHRATVNPLPIGNAYAALTELRHFWQGRRFSATYLAREGTVESNAAPFTRCVLLPLAASGTSGEEAAASAAEFLGRELCTGLGRAADQARTAVARPGSGPFCQSFGLYRFAFPRRALVAHAARRLCQGLVERWMSKDGVPLREAVRAWVAEHWSRAEYGPEGFIERLQLGCQEAIGEPPEKLFARLVEPIGGRSSLDGAVIAEALAQIEEQVGRPCEETLAEQPFHFRDLLRDAGDLIVEEWGNRVGELIVRLIETPQFRLAGAEEAIRELVGTLQTSLEHHEPLARELQTRVAETHERIRSLLAALQKAGASKSRQLPAPAEVVELLRCFAKWRYQGLVLQQVTRGLVSLRGLLSDELREVNFCRARLAELARAFDERAVGDEADPGSAMSALPGRGLFPGRCGNLEEAATHLLKGVTAEQLTDLDGRMQAMIHHQFTALVHVCLAPANVLRNVELAMQEQAESLVRALLVSVNAAELFFAEQPDESAAQEAIAAAYEEAAPELGARGGESCLLVVPPGPAGARFRELARQALPRVPLIAVVGGEDVLFYREAAQLPFADLEQLGPAAREAYATLARREHFTPHTRRDIVFRSEW